jgi:hypothetical protein
VILLIVASLAGIFFSSTLYPTQESVESYLTNDVINLLIGVPALLGSVWLTRQGRLAGLLFWPGALIYVLYNYLAVLLGVPLSIATLLYGSLIFLSASAGIRLFQSIDMEAVRDRLKGLVYEWVAAIVLLLFGVGFLLLAISIVAGGISNPDSVSAPDFSVSIADLAVSWLWILGGLWLLRKSALGYASALGLLFAAFTLIVGLMLFLLLRPLLTEARFDPVELLPIPVFLVICVVPLGLYLRGVTQADRGA